MSLQPTNPERLSIKDVLILLGLAAIVYSGLCLLQPVPGYMDAAYYYAGARRLAEGYGFSEPFLWNYLDPAASLPHASHAYWYPLASIIGALGMWLSGRLDFFAARLFFLAAAILAPLATARFALRMTGKRLHAMIAGCLAVFSAYYLPFMVTIDNYALYLLIGALYFTLLPNATIFSGLALGILAGLLNLGRADGLIWLPITVAAVFFIALRAKKTTSGRQSPTPLLSVLLVVTGYLVPMGWWLVRNLIEFSSLTPPGTKHVLWMTAYDQLYSLHPQAFTFSTWLASGWKAIGQARLEALGQNLGTGVLGQGMVLLSPFIAAGIWRARRYLPVQIGVLAWVSLLLAHSILFPFASVRGGFFHAGAVLQPLWFSLVAPGIESILTRIKRFRTLPNLRRMVLQLPILVMAILSLMLVNMRVIQTGWNEGEYRYLQAGEFLDSVGSDRQDIILTSNPPAFYAMTGRPTIVIPSGGMEELLEAAVKYKARYLVLEADRVPDDLLERLVNQEMATPFRKIGELDDFQIYAIQLP